MKITLCFWLFKNSQLWTCFPALLQLQSVEEITSALRILFWTYPIWFWVVQLNKTLVVACAPQRYKKKVFRVTPGGDHYLKCRPNNIYFTANISDFLKKFTRELKRCTWRAGLCGTLLSHWQGTERISGSVENFILQISSLK